jgi:uncharacterized phiE125 gp8 family phage protein
MLAPVRVAPPDITPVSLADVKAQLRVDHTDDDAMIGALLMAATERFDGWTGTLGRSLVEQTWRQEFACFAGCLRLPLAPVLSVESITYFDGENAQQTIDASVYALFSDARGPYVGLKPDQSWPGNYARRDAISVTFKAGYVTTPAQGETPARSTVPEPIKLAIILQVKLNYDPLQPPVRESYGRAIDALVAPFRRVGA